MRGTTEDAKNTKKANANIASPGAPDEFSFFLTDPTNTGSLVSTSDPTGADALFTLDATGSGLPALALFTPTTPGVSFRVTPQQSVPEPSPLAAGGVGVFVCALLICHRRARR
jgi:hypothetical protein